MQELQLVSFHLSPYMFFFSSFDFRYYVNIHLNHPTELIIIPALQIARQWEILSQRMSFKPIIGQDAAKIGVVGEVDAVHVPHLPLIPVGSLVDPVLESFV